jgi:hypothetical protein
MEEFLKLRAKVTPVLLPVVCWICAVLVVITGIIEIVRGVTMDYGGGLMVLLGITTMFVGPVLVLIAGETIMILFEIHSSLEEAKKLLQGMSQTVPQKNEGNIISCKTEQGL